MYLNYCTIKSFKFKFVRTKITYTNLDLFFMWIAIAKKLFISLIKLKNIEYLKFSLLHSYNNNHKSKKYILQGTSSHFLKLEHFCIFSFYNSSLIFQIWKLFFQLINFYGSLKYKLQIQITNYIIQMAIIKVPQIKILINMFKFKLIMFKKF